MISHSYFSRILYYLVNVEKVLRKLKFLQNKKARQSINEMQKNMSHGFYIIAYQQQIVIRPFFTQTKLYLGEKMHLFDAFCLSFTQKRLKEFQINPL